MFTEQEEKEMRDEWRKSEEELQEKWENAKKELAGLIHPKYFDFAENHETFCSEGIVEIQLTDERKSGYRKYAHCRIKGDDDSMVYINHTGNVESLDEESKYEGEEVEYWVWQTTGHLGDDYSGFLLLPLLDGVRFWKIGYSC